MAALFAQRNKSQKKKAFVPQSRTLPTFSYSFFLLTKNWASQSGTYDSFLQSLTLDGDPAIGCRDASISGSNAVDQIAIAVLIARQFVEKLFQIGIAITIGISGCA